MRIYIFGRRPPPVGGVTVHTERLGLWLSDIGGVDVRFVDIKPAALLRFMGECLLSRSTPIVVHCQTSSAWGPILVHLILRLTLCRAGSVYSLHSEYWVSDNILSGGIRALLAKHAVRRFSLLIADNSRIARDIKPYANKVKVLVPFLPPRGELSDCRLNEYLGVDPFDAPVLVFNAYKLVYRDDGSDVYGLRILLDAYLRLDTPMTLLLLIPQLSDSQIDEIRAVVAGAPASVNRGRVHIVSRPEIEGWKVIALADLFVRPTITDGDALSVREALYFGVPTIASDCTVRPEGVVLFRTGDANHLAEQLSKFPKLGTTNRTVSSVTNPAAPFEAEYRQIIYGALNE